MQDQETPQQPNTFPIFSKTLFFKTNIILQHSHKVKKNMQDFLSAFNKRIDAQSTYQKHLMECSKMLEKYIEPTSSKSISFIASAFKVDNQQRAAQASDLAESLKSQVIVPISEETKQYGNLIKKIQKTTKKLGKDYTYFFQNYDRAEKNYNENDNSVKEMIIMKNIYRFTSQFPQQKKNKLIAKTMQSIKEKSEYQKLYRTSVSQFNELTQIYKKQNTENLNSLQMKQRQLIKLQSDAIRKLIVCEVSMFKNVQYDLINISKQMQKMYPQNDILEFKKEIEKLEDSEKDKDLSFRTIQNDNSLLNLSLRNVEQEYYPWLLTVKKNKLLRKALQLRLKALKIQDTAQNQKTNNIQGQKQQQKNQEKGSEIKQQAEQTMDKTDKSQQTPEKVDTRQSLMKQLGQIWQNIPIQILSPPAHPSGTLHSVLKRNQVYDDFIELSQIIHQIWFENIPHQEKAQDISEIRKSKQSIKSQTSSKPKKNKDFANLIEKNNLIRILAYMFIEEYITQHHVMMEWDNYNKGSQLIRNLLDIAEEKRDVFVIKGILSLIFTFYSVESETYKKMVFQHNLISNCDIWKKNDYWNASIFQSTYQIMAGFTIQNGETQSDTLLREKNMIFNQLASYCHYMLMLGVASRNVRIIVGRYCRLYEMSEDQNRDLSKMISNTTKQIKQTQMINQAKTMNV